MRKPRVKVIAAGVLSCSLLGIAVLYVVVVDMPGESRKPPLPALSEEESTARERLRADLDVLARQIGDRNTRALEGLERAAAFIEERLRAAEYSPARQTFDTKGIPTSNIEVVITGEQPTSLVVGAHYDTAWSCPGANDNGTGVVSLLELARRLHGIRPKHTLRLVFFTNEEPPHFDTELMGSFVYANQLAAIGTQVVGMLSLETMGFYSDEEGSQRYPPVIGAVYPSRGNFIGFIGNVGSRALVRETVSLFRDVATIPSEGTAAFATIPGVGWSDHASFWRHDWPALMVTDTAPFRYEHYHTSEDTIDKVDFDGLARVTIGLEHVIRKLAKAH
ncbi:MAG: M28 family peptidase [Polyangiaceae bacterium]|nr:M28 family peptidase [Polyangiaceae bacterium]